MDACFIAFGWAARIRNDTRAGTAYVLELKLLRGSVEATVEAGLPQVVDYARRCGTDEVHLLMFDRRFEVGWDEKIWQDEARFEGMAVRIWGA